MGRVERFFNWFGIGCAVASLGIATYGTVNFYRSSREFERRGIEIEAQIEKIRNPIGEKCDYISDLPTEREWRDSLKQGKDEARLRGVSLYSWKAVVEPMMAKYQDQEIDSPDDIPRQNSAFMISLMKAMSRDADKAIEKMQKDFERYLTSQTVASKNHAEEVKKECEALGKRVERIGDRFDRAMDQYIEYELRPLSEKLERYLREHAQDGEKESLLFESFQLTNPLSSGHYSPRRFYEEFIQLLDQASRIENSDEKKKAVRRLVNLGVGYARHHLPPREYQIPLFFEFSELGYKPEELREMVIFK